jgi:hypothetical protein
VVPVQTFLPYPDFVRSAQSLDSKRLGKQRVEAFQVVRALIRPVYGWKHHPVTLMWAGYEEALGAYTVAVCRTWSQRGFADTVEQKVIDELAEAGYAMPPRTQRQLRAAGALPPWLGNRALHRSHRSALLRKDPDWYGERFDEPNDLDYVWPVHKP